jgi:hypothetical protein
MVTAFLWHSTPQLSEFSPFIELEAASQGLVNIHPMLSSEKDALHQLSIIPRAMYSNV